MISPLLRHRRRLGQAPLGQAPLGQAPLGLLLASALACMRPSIAEPSASLPEPTASEPTPDMRASPPPPTERSGPNLSPDGLVTLIAKPGLWPLDVESARRVLQALGPVTREQPTPRELSLVGGPFGALERFDVAYSLDDDQYWVFGSAGFVIGNADLPRLYHAMEARLNQLLGKPLWTEKNEGGTLPSIGWDIGEAMTLSLAPSPDAAEPALRIAISDPHGERE